MVSAAFKFVSGDPKLGIVVGFQTASAIDVLWAVMLDLRNYKVSYGIHYSGFFRENSWESIGTAPSNWLYDWHRIAVQTDTAAGTFSVRCWIDPYERGSSSSGPNLTKTIPIDYPNPVYTLTGIQPWGGGVSGTPQDEFQDGRMGFYVYGGAARVAELTVLRGGGNIVVPNKVPWLDR
jgi:hypothetical protein